MSKVEFAYRKLLLVSGRFKDTLEAAAERRNALGICTSLEVELSVYRLSQTTFVKFAQYLHPAKCPKMAHFGRVGAYFANILCT